MSPIATTSATAFGTARSSAAAAAIPAAARDDAKQLAQALRAGDLPAAREAYVSLAQQAPDGTTLQPGSPFAQLGKALAQGDIDAAKTAFGDMLRGAAGRTPPQPPSTGPIRPEPSTSSTGGTAGGTLNVVV